MCKNSDLSMNDYLGGAITRYLLEVATPISTDRVCQTSYSTGVINTATQLCSGGNKQGACQVRIERRNTLIFVVQLQ
jgi:hypothetical protein